MTEATHTPGPWEVEEYGDDAAPTLVIHADIDTRVCFMATPGSHGDPAKIEADARLIAAAPDMLGVLALAADYIKDLDGGNPKTDSGWKSEELLDVWLKARAAIAKATGATP